MDDQESPVEVPLTALDEATLRRIVSEFVSREGTDYGLQDITIEAKIEQVLAQLRDGSAALVVDTEIEAVNIIPRERLGG